MASYQINKNQITIMNLKDLSVNLNMNHTQISCIKFHFNEYENKQFIEAIKDVDIIKLPFCYGRILSINKRQDDEDTVIYFTINCWF